MWGPRTLNADDDDDVFELAHLSLNWTWKEVNWGSFMVCVTVSPSSLPKSCQYKWQLWYVPFLANNSAIGFSDVFCKKLTLSWRSSHIKATRIHLWMHPISVCCFEMVPVVKGLIPSRQSLFHYLFFYFLNCQTCLKPLCDLATEQEV